MEAITYFIFGIPNCLQISLQKTSPISVCLGIAEVLKVFGFIKTVWFPPSLSKIQPFR
jgi:hypothetical protein